MKTLDGTGAPLIHDAKYYLQDARGCVGNCGSWWRPNGQGYTCDIDDAGIYTGADVKTLRDTDIPWPIDYVIARVIRHVRVDNQAFHARDGSFERRQNENMARARRARKRPDKTA